MMDRRAFVVSALVSALAASVFAVGLNRKERSDG